MYEFTCVLSLEEELHEDIRKRQLLRTGLPYFDSDHYVSYADSRCVYEGISRYHVDTVCAVKDGKHYILLGEAYAARQIRDGKPAVFCTVVDLINMLLTDDDFMKKLKGNFIYIILDTGSGTMTIYSSRLSIMALYLTIDGSNAILSTNLSEIAALSNKNQELDYATIIEQQLFVFPFGERTILQNVKRVAAASIMVINKDGIKKDSFFDYRSYYASARLPYEKARDRFVSLLYSITADLTSDLPRYNVALTAGFDSRSITGIVHRLGRVVQNYAFGMPGCSNVTIPMSIAREQNFRFLPIWLNENYENDYEYWFQITVIMSDGFHGERANYPYAYNMLREFAPISINGNWGSEALRPVQNFDQLLSRMFFDVLVSGKPLDTFHHRYRAFMENSYIRPELLEEYRDEIVCDIEKWLDFVRDFSVPQQVHMNLYFENERKFFANESQTEKIYCFNRYPYYDDDIIGLLFQCPFSGINKVAFKKDLYSIYRSQHVYYDILKKYYPALLRYPTDHGFSPEALGSCLGLVEITAGYLMKTIRTRYLNDRTDRIANNREMSDILYRKRILPMIRGLPIESLLSPHFYGALKNETRFERKMDNIAAIVFWLDFLHRNRRM